MVNVIVILVIVAIVGVAVAYIVKEKKRGVKCIGCPYAGQCASHGKCNGSETCVGNCADSREREDES